MMRAKNVPRELSHLQTDNREITTLASATYTALMG